MMSRSPQKKSVYLRRLISLMRKESLQAVRDPSTILIAFVLPIILLFLFAYAVSLDVSRIRIGVVLENDTPEATELAAAFGATSYFAVTPARHRREIENLLVSGTLRGFIVIPQDFDARLASGSKQATIQIITDGVSPNTANFIAGYAQGVLANWNSARLSENGAPSPPFINLESRFWFNPEIESKRFLVPGAIAIVMTMIGTMLTALVVAREWERGTYEAIISTPIGVFEILLGKLIPYFVLGMLATVGCTLLATTLFGVPLRGSWPALLALSACFLVPALGQGLMISTITKNQFIAAQVALFSGFLPAFMLSGFLYEIDSMPLMLRLITRVIPASYYVSNLQTVFLTGDIWPQFLQGMAAMLTVGAVFFTITALKTHKRLDI
ncbi:MAG: ABC transporter permease [Desulforhopalus sp.]